MVGTGATTVSEVVIEIYRVFPNDSDVGRTSGAPTFSTSEVPTRVNSPSDVVFADRDSGAAGELTFSTSVLAGSFTALNSIQPGGIHPIPNQTTQGNGAVTGQEVQFNVNFVSALNLPGGHYFFVPQVLLSNGAQFYWLSASRPISGAGTTPFSPDLQAWTRDAFLDPDWLRVGTDIVGGTTPPTFNAAFSLNGTNVPEPSTIAFVIAGLALIGFRRHRALR
jgi:PEP-CTERM motif